MAFFSIFAFGSAWFWVATILPFLLLMAFIEFERTFWATATTILTIFAVIWLGNRGALDWIAHHPLTLSLYILGYIAAGICWGPIRWGFYIAKRQIKYDEFKAAWVSKNGVITDEPYPALARKANDRSPLEKEETYRQRFTREAKNQGKIARPVLSQSKERIMLWMAYWPASMVVTFLNDPIVHLYRFIYHKMIGVFEKVTDIFFSKYKDDFAKDEA